MKEKVYYNFAVKHFEGLSIKIGGSCFVKLSNYNLKFCDYLGKDILVINLKDIINAAVISDKELVQKDKSVIARGLVGGVLFGGVGLFLGGLSGVGSKSKEQNIDYLIVNYKDNGEDKIINVYANMGVISGGFIKGLNNAIELSKKDLRCPNCNKEVNFGDMKCPNCGYFLKDKKQIKKRLSIVLIPIFIIIAMIIIGIAVGANNSNNPNMREINIIKRVINVEEEKAEAINNILLEVGLNDFESITADSETLDDEEGEGSKGYRIKTDFSSNVILYLDKDNNVISIRYAGEDYYRNGNVINKFE